MLYYYGKQNIWHFPNRDKNSDNKSENKLIFKYNKYKPFKKDMNRKVVKRWNFCRPKKKKKVDTQSITLS